MNRDGTQPETRVRHSFVIGPWFIVYPVMIVRALWRLGVVGRVLLYVIFSAMVGGLIYLANTDTPASSHRADEQYLGQLEQLSGGNLSAPVAPSPSVSNYAVRDSGDTGDGAAMHSADEKRAVKSTVVYIGKQVATYYVDNSDKLQLTLNSDGIFTLRNGRDKIVAQMKSDMNPNDITNFSLRYESSVDSNPACSWIVTVDSTGYEATYSAERGLEDFGY